MTRSTTNRAGLPDRWLQWALCLLITLSFLLGGSSRGDTASLIVLRPAAIVLLGYGCWGLKKSEIIAYRHLFGMMAAMIALVLLHLVPLPPTIWSRLPGRELVTEIDRAAGLGHVWRPISLVPYATWNAFFSMAAPFGVLVLGVRTQSEDQGRVIACLAALAALSGLVAIMQIIGPPDRSITLYSGASGGAVGLFANRNHEAVYLAVMLPVFAIWATLRPRDGRRTAIVLISSIFFLPLILVAGSRAAIVCAVSGAAIWILLYGKACPGVSRDEAAGLGLRLGRQPHLRSYHYLAITVGITALIAAGVTIALGQAVSIQRLAAGGMSDTFRLQIWPPTLEMTAKYFPFGSGLGSFFRIYQVDEPANLLNTLYTNHAHNDFIESVMTGGLPAILLILYAAVLVGFRSVQLSKWLNSDEAGADLSRLGIVVIFMLSVASAVDYPLRTPALSALFALASVWSARPKVFAPPAS